MKSRSLTKPEQKEVYIRVLNTNKPLVKDKFDTHEMEKVDHVKI